MCYFTFLQITQEIRVINQFDKKNELMIILQEYTRQSGKIIIFVSTKRIADELTRSVRRDGYNAYSIHGDKSQAERDQALQEFKTNPQCNILIATDVAARGLDVKNITLVVNYDFPNNIEDYVHRIGRTGRAGNKGQAITLFTSNDSKLAHELIKLLQKSNQQIPQELQQMSYTAIPSKNNNRYGGGGGRFGLGKGSLSASGSGNSIKIGDNFGRY